MSRLWDLRSGLSEEAIVKMVFKTIKSLIRERFPAKPRGEY
jgi:hypothetical protein